MLCKHTCKHVHKPVSPHVHPSSCHQGEYQRREPAGEPGIAHICVPCLFCVLGCGFCFSSYYWCLCVRQTGSDGPALGGVQGGRVGPQTGSHLLCKTDSSQKGHREQKEVVKERLAECTATVRWPLFCVFQYYGNVLFNIIGSNYSK